MQALDARQQRLVTDGHDPEHGTPEDWVKSTVRTAVGRRTRQQVGEDDLMQEARMAVMDAATRWREDGGKSFRGFCIEGIRFRLRTYMRRLRRHPETTTLPPTLTAPEQQPAAADRLLSVWCESRPMRAWMHPRQRLFLYLKAVEGMKIREIAEAFGVSGTYVKATIATGRRVMRDLVAA